MILSHKHKFIFLKGKKVGGTSVEAALSKICGEEDIITPITLVDERFRVQSGARSCQNYSLDRFEEKNYLERIRSGDNASQPKSIFYNHMPLKEVLSLESADVRSYKVFFVERSPYSKIVSWANMQLKFKSYQEGGAMLADRRSIKEFLNKSFDNECYKSVYNMPIYKGFEEFECFVIKYENIERGFYEFCVANLGLRIPPLLPHLKKGVMSSQMSVNDFFSERQIYMINEFYADEFSCFGYDLF